MPVIMSTATVAIPRAMIVVPSVVSTVKSVVMAVAIAAEDGAEDAAAPVVPVVTVVVLSEHGRGRADKQRHPDNNSNRESFNTCN